jgi:thiosulfate reductase cytochrome b subunit
MGSDTDIEVPRREIIYRHALLVRVTHWINVLVLLVLLMSGLQIFNAHPALYLGSKSDFAHPVLSMMAMRGSEGGVKGLTKVLGAEFDTTGVLGASRGSDGRWRARGFPSWATLPGYQDLSMGRRWHFFFAWVFVINGLAYLIWSFASGHVKRDLAPGREELAHIGTSIAEHARFSFPQGEEAKRYNVLQKLAYLAVVFVLLPLMLLTGLTMSPGMDAGYPWLLDIFGGRQSARTIHFLTASAIVIFVAVHLFMVLISGLWNNLRSMITGRYGVTVTEDEA